MNDRISPLRALVLWFLWIGLSQIPVCFGLYFAFRLGWVEILSIIGIGLGTAATMIGLFFGLIEIAEKGDGPLKEANDYFASLFRNAARLIRIRPRGSRIVFPPEDNSW